MPKQKTPLAATRPVCWLPHGACADQVDKYMRGGYFIVIPTSEFCDCLLRLYPGAAIVVATFNRARGHAISTGVPFLFGEADCLGDFSGSFLTCTPGRCSTRRGNKLLRGLYG